MPQNGAIWGVSAYFNHDTIELNGLNEHNECGLLAWESGTISIQPQSCLTNADQVTLTPPSLPVPGWETDSLAWHYLAERLTGLTLPGWETHSLAWHYLAERLTHWLDITWLRDSLTGLTWLGSDSLAWYYLAQTHWLDITWLRLIGLTSPGSDSLAWHHLAQTHSWLDTERLTQLFQ